MGDRYRRSKWEVGYTWDIDVDYGLSILHVIWQIDMVFYHIHMVILDINMGYGLMISETKVSIWSSWISIWNMCY